VGIQAMFKIAIQHIIAEVALSTLFNRIAVNFRTPEIVPFIDSDGIDLPFVEEDIEYFIHRRDLCKTDEERSKYDNMITDLENVMTTTRYADVEGMLGEGKFYSYARFDELGEKYWTKKPSK
jgi:hypothetical protein